MPFPIDQTRCLAFAPTDRPLRLRRIPSQSLRDHLAKLGLFEGDEVRCEQGSPAAVLLLTRDGERVLVERELAVVIEVEPREAPAALRRSVGRPPVRDRRRPVAV